MEASLQTDVGADRIEHHRQRLMLGLAEAIREKGLGATQVTDIVRHAGASRKTFYRCFEDKDACFVAAAEALFALVRKAVEEAIDPQAPWEEQVSKAIDVFLSVTSQDPVLVSAFRSELPLLGAKGVAIQRQSMDRYVAMLVGLTATPSMQESGIAPVSPEVAVMLIAGLDGLLARSVERGEAVTAFAPVIKAHFVAGIRAASSA